MGLMRWNAWMLGLLLAGASFNHCLAEGAVTLEVQPWPAERTCKVCVAVQFGQLDMRLPLAEIGKVLVMDSDFSTLTILPPSGGPKESVEFLAQPPDKLMKEFERVGLLQGLGVTTNEQLFDAMGKLPNGNKSLTMLRKIEGIDTATRYTKMSKDSVHVYWIQSPLPGGSQKVYFVIGGEDVVYLLAGDVKKQFLDAVLANLRISNIP